MSAEHDSSFNPPERMLRQFAGVWIVFFGAIAAWQEFHHHRHVGAIVLAVLAVTVGPFGLVWPRAIRPVFIGWMAVTYPIGWTMSRIVLGVIFFGLFTPIAWIFRMIGRDELGLKSRPNAATYWNPKPDVTNKANYLRQF
jgi:hypothetical protein